jgi:hypothetical protein
MDSYVSHRQNISGIFFPYGSATSIDAGSDNTVSSIRKEEARIKFNFLSSETLSPPIAVNIVKDVFADAAIIGFEGSTHMKEQRHSHMDVRVKKRKLFL